jgi:hypothetical protein
MTKKDLLQHLSDEHFMREHHGHVDTDEEAGDSDGDNEGFVE